MKLFTIPILFEKNIGSPTLNQLKNYPFVIVYG